MPVSTKSYLEIVTVTIRKYVEIFGFSFKEIYKNLISNFTVACSTHIYPILNEKHSYSEETKNEIDSSKVAHRYRIFFIYLFPISTLIRGF